MLDWLKSKKYPEFWQAYLQKQENKSERYITLSLKSTGLNPEKDAVLTIGCVGIDNNKVVIKDTFEVLLLQYIYNHDHGFSNEFIIESKLAKLTESEALEGLVNFVENAVIIGHRIDLDLEMIQKGLEKIGCGRLKNEALDVEIMFRKWKEYSDDKSFSVTEIAKALKLPIEDYDSSIEESFTLALCFLKLKKYLKIE
jgi:DNA polymerase-3 subunit epsilon